MKLIIQIPCKDEAAQLPATLGDLPRELPGFDTVEWLVIDDGSTDETVAVARAGGVDHIVRLTNNKGLASAFQAGMDAALKLGADVIVNTDADNQYRGEDIAKLVEPIVAGRADMVIGDREVAQSEEFSPLKKRLQHLGSGVVRLASSTAIPDTTSGFRAYNREAALQIIIVSRFTYTLESIIQAGKQFVAIDHVPIRTNPRTRESRLFPSMWSYVRRSAITIFRIYAQYEPLRVFLSVAGLLLLAAIGVWAVFLVAYIDGKGAGHVQSLILGAVLFNAGVVVAALGVIGDLLSAQRTMLARTHERVRRVELALGVGPSHYERGAPLPHSGTGAGGGEPVERDAAKDAPLARDAAKDAPLARDAAKDAPLVRDAAKDAPLARDAAKDAPLARDAAKDAPLVRDAAKGAPLARDAAEDAPVESDAAALAPAAAEQDLP